MNQPATELQQVPEFDSQRAELQKERIKQALRTHDHLGIAADANTYGRRTSLQQAPFTQLEAALQSNQKLRMLLPTIWRREITRNIQRRMLEDLGNKKTQLDKAKGIKEAEVVAALDQAYARNKAAREAAAATAEGITNSYFKACSATDLPVTADSGKVIDMYFQSLPPFEPERNKPNEYRDAISLLDLDAYAQRESIDVVVVTNDFGCLRFCDSTKGLIGIQRLDELFEALQSHEDLMAMHALEARLNEQLKEDPSKLWKLLKARMSFSMSSLEPSLLSQLALQSQRQARHSFQRWFTQLVGEPQFQPFLDGRLLRLKSAFGDDVSIEVQMHAQVSIFAAGHYVRKGERDFHPDHREVTGEATLGVEAYVRIPGGDFKNLEEPEVPEGLVSLTVASGEFPQIVPPDPEIFRFVAVA